MKRVVSLWFPDWPTECFRRRTKKNGVSDKEGRGEPLVLTTRIGNRRLVYDADPKARAMGIKAGMGVAKAQALVKGLTLFEANPVEDARALEKTGFWAVRHVSPIVGCDQPDGLVIETSGVDHLFGGEEEMLKALISRLKDYGITARAAVADTWGAARALSHYGCDSFFVVPPGANRSTLTDLPLQALRLPADMTEDLRALGFERIGDLLRAPRAALARRFGPGLFLRLDQVLGDVDDPIEALRQPDIPTVERLFAEPIAATETVARYMEKLAYDLCEKLATRGLGGRCFDLVCQRVDSNAQRLRLKTSRPVRDPAQLVRLMLDRIENIDPGFGIEAMRLSAPWAEPKASEETDVFGDDPSGKDISSLVDTLTNRLGENRIYRSQPRASDIPERSVQRVSALSPVKKGGWSRFWPRPARLLPRPEPIETMALLPDHAPVWFKWRGVRYRIKRSDGPERVFGEWWRFMEERDCIRDYFLLEDETGRRYWVYRSGDGERPETGSQSWYLHGIFA